MVSFALTKKHYRVFLWTLALCAMVLVMVVIGGITRLTGSGLSIVEWKPLMGAIPPLSHIFPWIHRMFGWSVFGKHDLVFQISSSSVC